MTDAEKLRAALEAWHVVRRYSSIRPADGWENPVSEAMKRLNEMTAGGDVGA